MEAHASPVGSPFANRRQKNLQKYRQHVQRKKTSKTEGVVETEDAKTTTECGTATPPVAEAPPAEATVEEVALEKEESMETGVQNLKLETPPASPLIGNGKSTNKKVTPLEIVVPPSPTSSSKGTLSITPHQRMQQVSSPVKEGTSPRFKRRSDIMKKLSKKKMNSHLLDSPSRALHDDNNNNNNGGGVSRNKESKVMTDSTANNNNHQEQQVLVETDKKDASSASPDTTNNSDAAAETKEQVENIEVGSHDPSNEIEAENNPVEDEDVNEDTPTSSSEIQEEASTSFDLRSIHDFPTEPIQTSSIAIECSQDSSWDTAKVFFSEYQGPISTSNNNNKEGSAVEEAVNMFETNDSTSWTATETAPSFSRTFETNNEFSASFEGGEEKKEKDASDTTTTTTNQIDAPDSPDSDMSQRHLRSRLQVTNSNNPLEDLPINPEFGFGFPDDVNPDMVETREGDGVELLEPEAPVRDDEDLLGDQPPKDDNDGSDHSWKNDTQLPKEERLQQYTSSTPSRKEDGADSSVCSSDLEQEEDESSQHSEDDDDADVKYMSHSEDEKDADDVLEGPVMSCENTEADPIDIVDNAPAFSLAAEAAVAAEEKAEAMEEQTTDDVIETNTLSISPDATATEEKDDVAAAVVEEKALVEGQQVTEDVIESNTLSISPDGTASEEETTGAVQEADKKITSFDDEIEDSTSLVGVSLVPSFNANNAPAATAVANKNHDGIPPRSALNLPLPPPPPPPLSAKKKKKRSNGPKSIPLLAPPPEEKLKKWQEGQNRAREHLAPVREEPSSLPLNERRSENEAATGALSPRGEMGAEELVCAAFTDAFDLAVSIPPDNCEGNSAQSVLSPFESARSIALENARKRANCSAAGPSPRLFDLRCGSLDAAKSLFEDDIGGSTSLDSSFSEDGPSLGKMFKNSNSEEHVGHKGAQTCPADYLQKLTSPSLSLSPGSGAAVGQEKSMHSTSPSASPIIPDQKMAEKVAMASYAAALKFEEKFSTSHHDAEASSIVVSDKKEKDTVGPTTDDTRRIPSLFCGNEEIQANLVKIANAENPTKELPSLFCGPETQKKFEDEFAEIVGSSFSLARKDKFQDKLGDLKGGAFGPWKNDIYAGKSGAARKDAAGFTLSSSGEDIGLTATGSDKSGEGGVELVKLHLWLTKEVLGLESHPALVSHSDDVVKEDLSNLLEEDLMLNKLCHFVCEKVNEKIGLENDDRAERNTQLSPRKKMRPFALDEFSASKSSSVVAANFVSFMQRMSKASGIPSPFGEENPFILDLVSTSIHGTPSPRGNADGCSNMQKLVFNRCSADKIVNFFFIVCGANDTKPEAPVEPKLSGDSSVDMIEACRAAVSFTNSKERGLNGLSGNDTAELSSSNDSKRWIVPDEHPSPFERAVETNPKVLTFILECLGDPVAVCRVKMLNRNCRNFVAKHEQVLMRDAVRLGGMSMNVRPAFWLWVTLEKFSQPPLPGNGAVEETGSDELRRLERAGLEGKWHHVIQRDVSRSFGNMPPHKTGARLRTDSIVRALVTWGRNRIMKRGVKGDGIPPCSSSQASVGSDSDAGASQAPTDTVSDWGGVSPVASFNGSNTGGPDGEDKQNRQKSQSQGQDSQSVAADSLVLSGNALTDEMKADLQNKLGFILHALAASHDDVGYCQGMDYVVAHLLRILQDTVRWRAARGSLPSSIESAPRAVALADFDADSLSQKVEEIDETLVVEETVFRVMNTLFTTYNLQHMYWPELRCLKTCCRVFERLIQIKLPVLADHFEHHELNVGLFALGWFQTLFLYLPSMPSATVCHMWDIWLVERSFKIFFRVGTAILFLSQPILLNHELEGMMTYLNTFPDATLLNPDILIACALQIKVTNKMLMEIEAEVSG